jgi:hypothetical protein
MANNEKIINKLWHNEVGRVERIGGGKRRVERRLVIKKDFRGELVRMSPRWF